MKYTAAQINRINNAKKQLQEVKTDTNFLQLPKKLFGVGLNSDQIIVLSHIYETIQMSWTNEDDFYDNKRHAYYAVINREDMADKINTTPNTIGTVIQELCDIGYISKVQSWNHGLKIFVRHFSKSKENKKSESSKIKNSKSNETQLNDTHITSDTKHTTSEPKIENKIEILVEKAITKLLNENNKNNMFDDNKDDEHLKYAILGTKSMPTKAAHSISIIANNLYSNPKKRSKFTYDINGMIFKRKYITSKNNNLDLKWEHNQNLVNQFNHSIYEMLYASFSGKREVDNSYAYFGGAIKNFFNKFANKKLGKSTSKKHKKSGRKHIHEKVHEEFKEGYKPNYPKISKERKAELDDKLRMIKSK